MSSCFTAAAVESSGGLNLLMPPEFKRDTAYVETLLAANNSVSCLFTDRNEGIPRSESR